MVYIIILTWNGMKYLPTLFKSLAVLNYEKDKYRLLVIDSGSTDGSVDYVESQAIKGLKLIKLTKNLGFVKGNNLGMQYALEQGAAYVLLLNQDTEVTNDFLEKLVKKAEGEQKIGVVQPLILYYKNRNEINSAGNKLHYLGFGWCDRNHESLSEVELDECKNITYASATAVLYKAEMLKEIGLFDENIFSYHEDSEICLRAKVAGWQILLEPKAHVFHDYSFPTTKNKIRYFWMEKNRLYIVLKFYKLKTLFLIWPMMLFMDMGQLYFALTNGYLWQWLKSRWWFVYNFFGFVKARRVVQKKRKINDQKLLEDFVSEINYQEVSNSLLDKIANPIMKKYWQLIRKYI